MTHYEDLIHRANKCRIKAINAQTEWGRNFCMSVANKLEEEAANLPLIKASAEAYLNEKHLQGE